MVGLGIHYRRAPEYPYPTAVEDVLKAYDWLLYSTGINPKQIVVAGESAGGLLILQFLLRLKMRVVEKLRVNTNKSSGGGRDSDYLTNNDYYMQVQQQMPKCAVLFSPGLDVGSSVEECPYSRLDCMRPEVMDRALKKFLLSLARAAGARVPEGRQH